MMLVYCCIMGVCSENVEIFVASPLVGSLKEDTVALLSITPQPPRLPLASSANFVIQLFVWRLLTAKTGVPTSRDADHIGRHTTYLREWMAEYDGALAAGRQR